MATLFLYPYRNKLYIYFMDIRKTLEHTANFNSELEMIEYNLVVLSIMARTIIEQDTDNIDMILETLPNNNIRPITQPLFSMPRHRPTFFSDEPEENPSPLGFQRFYTPEDAKSVGGTLNIVVEIPRHVALAVIDTAMNRLVKRKNRIISDSKRIFSIPRTNSEKA